ncbi:MAG: MATE family efflux transporter [Clostridia bacterium]|nr:MATE family efflux transporter [Clostridia bacterium]
MENRGTNLTEGVIWKQLLKFFFPILLGTLFQQLYNTIDAIIVGNFVGAHALAAVGGSPSQILNLLIGFFVGLASGAMVIISHYFGAGDRKALSDTVHTAVAFCLITGAVLSVFGYFLSPWMLRVVRTPEDILADSASYLRTFFIGIIPLMLFNIGSGILRAVGDSKRPLYFLIVCCVLNIVLDIIFVALLHLGVLGVAWATVISLTVSACLVIWSLYSAPEAYQLRFSKIRLHRYVLSRVLYIGVPAGIESVLYSVSNLIIQIQVNGLGSSMVAAWTATGKWDGVFWSVSNSFGITISAFVGQAFGAKKYDRMRQSIRTCLYIALASSAVLSTLLLVFGRFGLRIFTSDAQVIDLAVEIIGYFIPYYTIWTFIEILANALRGAGDSIRPMIISLVGICGFRLIWCAVAVPLRYDIMMISICYPISWALTAAAFLFYYHRSDWLSRCIRLEQHKTDPV